MGSNVALEAIALGVLAGGCSSMFVLLFQFIYSRYARVQVQSLGQLRRKVQDEEIDDIVLCEVDREILAYALWCRYRWGKMIAVSCAALYSGTLATTLYILYHCFETTLSHRFAVAAAVIVFPAALSFTMLLISLFSDSAHRPRASGKEICYSK